MLKALKYMAKKIVQRIDGVLKMIDRVQKEMSNISFDEFKEKDLLHDAVSFSVSQVGERMNRLEEYLSEKHPTLPWKEARKMRNIIVHDYDNVDYEKVFLTATKDLPILREMLVSIKKDITRTKEKTLTTNRLILRPWDDYDVDELFELAKDQEIGYWCGWPPHKHIRESFFMLHNFLEKNEVYAVCLKNTNEIIGSVGLCSGIDVLEKNHECELEFWIGKKYWGSGYAIEATNKLIEHAFTKLNISTIWCNMIDGNERSKRVQDKLGFVYCHTNNYYVAPIKMVKTIHSSVLYKKEWLLNK